MSLCDERAPTESGRRGASCRAHYSWSLPMVSFRKSESERKELALIILLRSFFFTSRIHDDGSSRGERSREKERDLLREREREAH